MHDTALEAGRAFFSAYASDLTEASILDVGALNINGSLRPIAPPGAKYVGVDMQQGVDVDVVVEAGELLPFPNQSLDLVVSSSCFEHDPMFWVTIIEIMRVLKVGGHLLLNAPSNGPYHSHPHDNWRFYPDAGLALVSWCRRQGFDAVLRESGILRRQGDVWNDFVAVLGKGQGRPCALLLDSFPNAMNVRIGDVGVRSMHIQTEDQEIANELQQEIQSFAKRLAESQYQTAQHQRELALLTRSWSWSFVKPLWRIEAALLKKN